MCPNEETLQHMQKSYPRCTAINTGGNTILDAIRLSGVARNVVDDSTPYLVASLHRFQNIYEKKTAERSRQTTTKCSYQSSYKICFTPSYEEASKKDRAIRKTRANK